VALVPVVPVPLVLLAFLESLFAREVGRQAAPMYRRLLRFHFLSLVNNILNNILLWE
jgi:hypothetical protein